MVRGHRGRRPRQFRCLGQTAANGSPWPSACQPLGLCCLKFAAPTPHSPAERAQLAKLWARAVGFYCALLLSVADGDSPETVRQAMLWIAQLPGAVLCNGPTPCVMRKKRMVGIEVPRMLPDERTELLTSCSRNWTRSLRRCAVRGIASVELSMQFQIGRDAVVAACQREQDVFAAAAGTGSSRSDAGQTPIWMSWARRVEPK